MNLETKQNVVEAILLAKDTDTIWDSSTVRYYLNRYDAALPDDLPVIPEAVGEWIKSLHKYHRDLVDVFGMVRDLGITRTEPTGVLVWVTHNIETFARAWVLGVWKVEETGEIVKLEEKK